LDKIKSLVGVERYHSGKFNLAITLFDHLVLNTEFEEFLTLKGYKFLE